MGFRTEVDSSTDSFNKKIRNAVTQKIPNIVIVGNNEAAEGTITLRRYCVKEQLTMSKADFIARMERLVKNRTMDNFAETSVS
jgi:threonyl-tRNA synthetase